MNQFILQTAVFPSEDVCTQASLYFHSSTEDIIYNDSTKLTVPKMNSSVLIHFLTHLASINGSNIQPLIMLGFMLMSAAVASPRFIGLMAIILVLFIS